MGNLVSELNVKRDREGSRAPLVLGPGEGLSMYFVKILTFGDFGEKGRMMKAKFDFLGLLPS